MIVEIEAVDIPPTTKQSNDDKSGFSYLNKSTLSMKISVSVVDRSPIIFAVEREFQENLCLRNNFAIDLLSTSCLVQLSGQQLCY